MKWMSNLKIRRKLLLGFGVVLSLMLFLAILAAARLASIDTDYSYVLDQYVVPRVDAIKEADLRISKLRRAVSVIGVYVGEDDKISAAEPQIHSAYKAIQEPFDEYVNLVKTDPRLSDAEEQERINKVNEVLTLLDTYYNTIAMGIIQETKNNDVDAVSALITEAGPIIDVADDATTEIVNEAEALKRELSDACSTSAKQAFLLLVVVAAAAIVIGLLMMLVITKAITTPVGILTSLLSKVSDGDLDVNASSNSRDEIGDLTRDVGKVVDVIKSLVTDINHVSREFDKGETDAKMDEGKYRGSYQEVAAGFNKSLGTIVDESNTFIRCMIAFSEGDFEADIPKLPGKKAIMNTSRDQLRSNLMGVNNDIARLVDKASAGELDARINEGKYKGDWNTLVASLNGLMESIATPIGEALTSLTELSKGNLSARVIGDYKGQFGEIKKCVNSTMQSVGSYIQEISNILGKMAEENDLTQEISRQYVGDFDKIKSSINMILNRMSRIMSEFNAASEQVYSGAKMISESSMSLAQGATEQASAVQELNASVELINEQIRKSADDADSANLLSTRSRENALKGNEEMSRMLSSMEDIKKSSDNISKINKVIADIAFQTNLLALNAAVEASRAGEHGRGFSVVAEEVRNLAAKSQSASKETTELINTSIQRVEEGQEIAAATAESLEKIVDDFSEVSSIISGIAKASNEQAYSIQQIATGLSQISEVVQDNSSTSEEAAATSEELSGQAEMLKSMVAEFKTK